MDRGGGGSCVRVVGPRDTNKGDCTGSEMGVKVKLSKEQIQEEISK